MKIYGTTSIALAILLVGAGSAFAQDYRGDEAEEVRALERVQISLAEAIAAAEGETGGRALDAQLEVENGRIFYQVEVFEGNGIKEVYVDPQDRAILDVVDDWD